MHISPNEYRNEILLLAGLCTNNLKFLQSHALGHEDESTDLALVIECSLLGCLGKLVLDWLWKRTVAFRLSDQSSLALRHCPVLSLLVG